MPSEDYLSIQNELECLRADHIITLRREVEARITALKSLEQGNEIRTLRVTILHNETDLHSAQITVDSLKNEIIHQKDVTLRALSAVHSPTELSTVISEMARFRGEASRLEVEVEAGKRRYDLLEMHLKSVSKEVEEAGKRVKELEGR